MVYELQHYHNNMWWGLGVRTDDQIRALSEVSDWHKEETDCIYFHLSKLFKGEPHFRALKLK